MAKDVKALAMFGGMAAVILGGLYMQFRIIYDCGFMALFQGAEWWWLLGYCK